jgi:pimeloyl-ACP methyl ester carboxylesterase
MVQEYMHAHWAFRTLSDLLSTAGFHVLRFDYAGTGDSSGDSGECSATQWKADVRTAASELRDTAGTGNLSIVGLRFGAALAAEACAAGVAVRDLVLWDPVTSGARHAEELKAMHFDLRRRFRVRREEFSGRGSDELLGYPFTPKMRQEVEKVDLLKLPPLVADRVIVVVSEERPDYLQLRERLDASGIPVEYREIEDAYEWGVLDNLYARLICSNIPKAITQILLRGET